MEITSRTVERENPSSTSSPNSNGVQIQTPPLTPKPMSRSEPNNPYPTTFVQADTTTFKHVVQMLTGSPETQAAKQASSASTDPPPTKNCIPPIKTGQKKQSFKLYERRSSLKNGLMINPLIPGLKQNFSGFSPRKSPEILSPSILNFPALALSPVTPLMEDAASSPSTVGSSSEEEKAIAEKGFYLHPSPRASGSGPEPRLLPLFPVTSPRVPETSSS
ncbi:hypothetical protein NMG60_11037062 [Bertholletia excelsa]